MNSNSLKTPSEADGTMHLAFNIDANFVRPCAVLMASVFYHNPNEIFRFHIVCTGVPDDDRRLLVQMASRAGSSVCFYDPDPRLLEGFRVLRAAKRIPPATYYRCMLSDLLPESVKRVLYMDCDMLVLGKLRPLWETQLEEKAAAAVDDVCCDEEERYRRLDYDASLGYFNSGVVLMNLSFWRRHGIVARGVDYYRRFPERILFSDQDLLNVMVADCKQRLPRRWNMQDGFYRFGMDARSGDPEAWREALRRPEILHFTNRKPWQYDNLHPLRHLWIFYLMLTPWRPKDGKLHFAWWQKAHRWVHHLPYRLHLRRPKYLAL